MVTIGEALTSEFWGGGGRGRPPDSRRHAGATENQSSVFGLQGKPVVGVRFPVLGNVVVGRRSSVVSLK
jgi:hypothetical protein